ncbi:MAG TPA: hypothetical protein DHD79_10560 [Firmicutes bacterium]|jgi:murein DD-endopeptidase MepM/ murein hydrolase activator NlpD|nr:hypothetical protein [Bacillota bacterium]HBG44007.1 hypothetical protein [Bacillota bacterium]HBL51268.1 hypothetical protein [Bacillota bacterium]HBL67618.1 hypothetical protein [Bacillota bacterium]HCF91822.1 hypothetical protein [Bacillota bacterium]
MSLHLRRLLALVLALNLGAVVTIKEVPLRQVMGQAVAVQAKLPWLLSRSGTQQRRKPGQPVLGLAVYNRLPKSVPAPEATAEYNLPCMHLVREGESLSLIASALGTVPQAIMRANNLEDPNEIITGTYLFIPQPSSSELQIVAVSQGDTIADLSQKYGLTSEALCRLNGLEDPEGIAARQQLVVPSMTIDWPRPTVSRSLRTATASSMAFAWPVSGMLTSLYGWRNDRMHYGIDVAAPAGTSVKAAADGVVESAGWRGSYGLLVVILHKDDWRTYYSHNAQILVQEGQSVSSGQVIAVVGCTGRATGNHLHFEVHRGEQRLNPLTVLPTK